MSATLNDNFDTQFPKPIDSRFGPYADISTALTQVPSYRRYEGLTIGIGVEVVEEYWFKEGIADDDLILKIPSSDGVDTIIAGDNITISPTNGKGDVTINSEGGGGGDIYLFYNY